MLTLDELKAYGANTEEGLGRCMGMSAFYLKLVGMLKDDHHMEGLAKALAENNLDAAFEEAHALKGVLANLALTPVLEPVSEMTELLRTRAQTDYSPLLSRAQREMDRLLKIING